MSLSTLNSTLPPRLNPKDETGRIQIHKAQLGKNRCVVAPGAIQDIAAQPWA